MSYLFRLPHKAAQPCGDWGEQTQRTSFCGSFGAQNRRGCGAQRSGRNERRRRGVAVGSLNPELSVVLKKTQPTPGNTTSLWISGGVIPQSAAHGSRLLNALKRNATDAHLDVPKKTDVYWTRASTLEKIRFKHQPQMNVTPSFKRKKLKLHPLHAATVFSNRMLLPGRASTLTRRGHLNKGADSPRTDPKTWSLSAQLFQITRPDRTPNHHYHILLLLCSALKAAVWLIDGEKVEISILRRPLCPQLCNFLFGIRRQVVTRHERECELGPRWHSERGERGERG